MLFEQTTGAKLSAKQSKKLCIILNKYHIKYHNKAVKSKNTIDCVGRHTYAYMKYMCVCVL